MDEIAAMRGLLEGQFAQLAWSDAVRRQPLRAQFTRDLLRVGYSAALARADHAAPARRLLRRRRRSEWLVGVIARNLRCVDAADDIVTRGGVYALVGPTGVGKTTTTAKLAARCAVRYGARALALLTTDSYRIGAQDQLRIYAKILGVSVHTVTDATDLRQALDSLSRQASGADRHRRHGAARQRALPSRRTDAGAAGSPAPAAAQRHGAGRDARGGRGRLRRRGAGATADFAGCIITKMDESARPGPGARRRSSATACRSTTSSNGQRVPEDLQRRKRQLPRAPLAAHAAGMPPTSPFRLQDDEVSRMLLGRSGAAHA